MVRKLLVAPLLALGACGTEPDDMSVYTLYRSPIAGNELIHVATFDAAEERAYNSENCSIVAGLMQSQPGVTVVDICQPGRFLP